MLPLFAYVVLAFPQAKTDLVKAQLQARYDGLSNAFAHRDRSVLDRLFAADFVGETPARHRLSRRAALAAYDALMFSGDRENWPRKVLSVRMERGEAIATVSGHYTNIYSIAKGKSVLHELITTSDDRWRRSSDGWRLVGWKYQRYTELMDGKDISPRRS